MVILSLPSMSNSFLGHPNKVNFRPRPAKPLYPNQTCPIPHRLPLRSFAMPPVLYSVIKQTHGGSPDIPAAANFALADKNSLVSPESAPPGHIRGDGHL